MNDFKQVVKSVARRLCYPEPLTAEDCRQLGLKLLRAEADSLPMVEVIVIPSKLNDNFPAYANMVPVRIPAVEYGHKRRDADNAESWYEIDRQLIR